MRPLRQAVFKQMLQYEKTIPELFNAAREWLYILYYISTLFRIV